MILLSLVKDSVDSGKSCIWADKFCVSEESPSLSKSQSKTFFSLDTFYFL